MSKMTLKPQDYLILRKLAFDALPLQPLADAGFSAGYTKGAPVIARLWAERRLWLMRQEGYVGMEDKDLRGLTHNLHFITPKGRQALIQELKRVTQTDGHTE